MDDLVKRLRNDATAFVGFAGEDLRQAADAVEELSKKYLDSEVDNTNLTGRLAEEHAKNRWIPVTERLPKHLTSVIVHRKDGGIFIWEYFDTSPTDDCWIDDSMNVYSFYDVTHWMSLPQPPKEE